MKDRPIGGISPNLATLHTGSSSPSQASTKSTVMQCRIFLYQISVFKSPVYILPEMTLAG